MPIIPITSGAYSLGVGLTAGAGVASGIASAQKQQREQEQLAKEAARREAEFNKRMQLLDAQMAEAQRRQAEQQQQADGNAVLNQTMMDGMQLIERYRQGDYGETPEDHILGQNFQESLKSIPKDVGPAGEVLAGGFFSQLLGRLSPEQKAALARTEPGALPDMLHYMKSQLDQMDAQRALQSGQQRIQAMMQPSADGSPPVLDPQTAQSLAGEKNPAKLHAALDAAQNEHDESVALQTTKQQLIQFYAGKVDKAELDDPEAILSPRAKEMSKLRAQIPNAKTHEELSNLVLQLESLREPDGAMAMTATLLHENAKLSQELQQLRMGQVGKMPPIGRSMYADLGAQPQAEGAPPMMAESTTAAPAPSQDIQKAAQDIASILSSTPSKAEQNKAVEEYLSKNGISVTPELIDAVKAAGKPKPMTTAASPMSGFYH